jgi:hypothetical protein
MISTKEGSGNAEGDLEGHSIDVGSFGDWANCGLPVGMYGNVTVVIGSPCPAFGAEPPFSIRAACCADSSNGG